jgi:hypothetical protein
MDYFPVQAYSELNELRFNGIFMPVCLSVYTYLSISLPICPTLCLSTYSSVSVLSFHRFSCPSVFPFQCMLIHSGNLLSVGPTVSLLDQQSSTVCSVASLSTAVWDFEIYLCLINDWPLLWSSGQSSGNWFLWGTNWIYICYVEESRPPQWSSGQSSWLYNGVM